MYGTQNRSGEDESLLEALKPAICAIVSLKSLALEECRTELQSIVSNKITSPERIETLFDKLLSFYEDEDFAEVFWDLIHHVETFDTGISSFYRREYELLTEGP